MICEIDEQWSYVSSKHTPHWLWYAFDTERKRVLAYTFGPRTDQTCRRLLNLLAPLCLGLIMTDNWGCYIREIPDQMHLFEKIYTQRIERHNLTLRTHIKQLARKTVCSSRSVQSHEKVIGAFIEKYHFI